MAELKGKALKVRLEQFEKWISTLDMRLEKLSTYKEGLDFSPESLNVIEQLVLDYFTDPMDALSIDKAEFSDMIGSYIGEVFIRNFPTNIKWKAITETSVEYKGYYNFNYMLGSQGQFIGFNPFSNTVLFALNSKTGNTLLEFYNKKRNFFEKNSISESQKNKTTLPINGFAYQTFLLFENDALTLNDVERTLTEYVKKKNASFQYYGDNHLVLSFNTGYNFHFNLDKRPDVIEESKEMSQSLNTPDLAKCNSRIEFWGDDDPNLDYMNESLFILERIKSSNPHVIMVDVNK